MIHDKEKRRTIKRRRVFFSLWSWTIEFIKVVTIIRKISSISVMAMFPYSIMFIAMFKIIHIKGTFFVIKPILFVKSIAALAMKLIIFAK